MNTKNNSLYTTTCSCGKPKSTRALSCPECNKDLIYYLALQTNFTDIDMDDLNIILDRLIKAVKEPGIEPFTVKKCDFCGAEDAMVGYNPYPVNYKGYCCFYCIGSVIKTRRVEIMRGYEKAFEIPLGLHAGEHISDFDCY